MDRDFQIVLCAAAPDTPQLAEEMRIAVERAEAHRSKTNRRRGQGGAMTHYWDNLTARRISRRRALTTTGGLVASAAFLAACGGGSKSTTKETPSSLVYVPKEATGATKGGTFTSTAGDVGLFTTVGPLGAPDSVAAAHGYSRLVKQKVYKHPEEALPTAAPDAATSWEASPDGLTVTSSCVPTSSSTRARRPAEGR